MFLKYRMGKLEIKIKVQQAVVDKLEIAARQYGSSYYTDKYHREYCRLVDLTSNLEYLKGKLNN